MERWRTDAGSFSRQRVLFGRVPIVLYMRAGSRPGGGGRHRAVEDGLRARLRILGKLTREGKADPKDMRKVLSAGVSRQQVEDALEVCAAFNTTDRLADAFAFELLSPEGFEASGKYLLKRGYR